MAADLTVHVHGETGGPVMVVLHGLSDSGADAPDLVRRWEDAWRVVAPSMRGHGTSPRFADDEMARTGDLMLADVLAIVDAEPEPVVLLGHSMGAVLALRAAVARPERVRALVLEDPPHPSAGPSPAEVGVGFEASVADVSARVDRLEELRAESRWSDAEVDAWARSKPLVQREVLRRGIHLGSQRWGDLIAAVSVPTLLVLPDSGSAAPADDTDRRSPSVREVVITDAEHCVRRDQPEAYYRAVEAFLGEVLAG